MKDKPLDPRIEKLVALLYGELPEDEEREMRALIKRDDALRAEWEELTSMRSVLHKWDLEEPAPGFVFVREREERGGPAGSLRGWRERLRGWTIGTAWATAAVAVVVAILAVNDFRIERSGGGMSFRFGPPEQQASLLAADAGSPSVTAEQGVPLASPPLAQQVSAPVDEADRVFLIPEKGPFVTRQEFESYVSDVTRTIVAMFNEYGREHDREVAEYLSLAFAEFANRQERENAALRTEIRQLGLGIAEEQFKTTAQLDYVLRQGGMELGAPASASPKVDTKGEDE